MLWGPSWRLVCCCAAATSASRRSDGAPSKHSLVNLSWMIGRHARAFDAFGRAAIALRIATAFENAPRATSRARARSLARVASGTTVGASSAVRVSFTCGIGRRVGGSSPGRARTCLMR